MAAAFEYVGNYDSETIMPLLPEMRLGTILDAETGVAVAHLDVPQLDDWQLYMPSSELAHRGPLPPSVKSTNKKQTATIETKQGGRLLYVSPIYCRAFDLDAFGQLQLEQDLLDGVRIIVAGVYGFKNEIGEIVPFAFVPIRFELRSRIVSTGLSSSAYANSDLLVRLRASEMQASFHLDNKSGAFTRSRSATFSSVPDDVMHAWKLLNNVEVVLGF